MSPTTRRARNRRGEGDLLRDEILSAAERLVNQDGSSDGLTLRAIAREAGISAPSIYAHFADREAVLDAVLDAGFERLHRTLTDRVGTVDGSTDPVRRLLAGCRGYVDFAMDEPAAYRLLFSRGRPSFGDARQDSEAGHVPPSPDPAWLNAAGPNPAAPISSWAPPGWGPRIEAFQILVDAIATCVAAGRSTSADPFADATALWTAMHGAVTLRQYLPKFPWPPLHEAVDRFAVELAHVTVDRPSVPGGG
ncbi:TetR/AcrR family transcriptional regulator [Micromonospora sp. NPDC050397]|uniref:TetR/AcrR family transcriptional regulator n=1 Tax=Micromonospora sp. NPDC050397 TaxID=3364279 RepID=UPI00384F3812